MNPEFIQALTSWGVDPNPLLSIWDDAQGVILREDDVGAIISTHAPALEPDAARKLAGAVYAQTTPIQRVFSTMLAAYLGERAQRPNTFVTLFAHDHDADVAPGGPYPLRPRNTGVLATEDYSMTASQSFLRMTCNQIDVTAGFTGVGSTFGLEGDKPKVFDQDFALTGFLHDTPVESTPLASWLGRTPKQNKRFHMDVLLTATDNQVFSGVTLSLFDSACRASAIESAWGPLLSDFDFGSASQSLINAILQRKAMMPMAQPQPAQSVSVRPMLNLGRVQGLFRNAF